MSIEGEESATGNLGAIAFWVSGTAKLKPCEGTGLAVTLGLLKGSSGVQSAGERRRQKRGLGGRQGPGKGVWISF